MTTERATIMGHAGTVMVGQLAVMAFSVTDTLVAGRFADTALAALAVASAARSWVVANDAFMRDGQPFIARSGSLPPSRRPSRWP